MAILNPQLNSQTKANLNKFVHTKPVFGSVFWDKKKYEYTRSNPKYNLNLIKFFAVLHLLSLGSAVFGVVQFLSLSWWYLVFFGIAFAGLIFKLGQTNWNILQTTLQQQKFSLTNHDAFVYSHWDYNDQHNVTIFINNCTDDLDIVRRCLLTVSNLKYKNYKVVFLDQTSNTKLWTICNIFNFEYIDLFSVAKNNHLENNIENNLENNREENLYSYIKKSSTQYNLVIDTHVELHPNYLMETVPYIGFYHQVKCNTTTSGENKSIVFRGYSSFLEDQVYNRSNTNFDISSNKNFTGNKALNNKPEIHNSIFDKAILEDNFDKSNFKYYKLPLCLCFGQCSSNIINYLNQNQVNFRLNKISFLTWLLISIVVMAVMILCFNTKIEGGNSLVFVFPYILVSIIFQSFVKFNKHSLANFVLGGAGLYYAIYTKLANKNQQKFVYFINGIGVVLTIWLYILALQGILFRVSNPSSFLSSFVILGFYFVNISLIIFINHNLYNIFHQYEFREFNNKMISWRNRHNQFKGNLANSLSLGKSLNNKLTTSRPIL